MDERQRKALLAHMSGSHGSPLFSVCSGWFLVIFFWAPAILLTSSTTRATHEDFGRNESHVIFIYAMVSPMINSGNDASPNFSPYGHDVIITYISLSKSIHCQLPIRPIPIFNGDCRRAFATDFQQRSVINESDVIAKTADGCSLVVCSKRIQGMILKKARRDT